MYFNYTAGYPLPFTIECVYHFATRPFVTPVGFEPTMDFRHPIKSRNRSASTGTESYFVRLVGLEPTVEINLLVKSQLL